MFCELTNSLFDSCRCRTSSDRMRSFTSVRCAQKKNDRNKSLTKKVSINPLQVTPRKPTVQRPKSACPLRLTDPLAPLDDALRSHGGVRVDASAPRV